VAEYTAEYAALRGKISRKTSPPRLENTYE
jgi:hypothetical protein